MAERTLKHAINVLMDDLSPSDQIRILSARLSLMSTSSVVAVLKGQTDRQLSDVLSKLDAAREEKG